MTFGAPPYLLLLVLPAGCAVLYAAWLAWRARAGGLLGARPRGASLATLATALLVASIALTALSAARPQYGRRETRVEDRGIDLVIVLDVSQSMLSSDVAPSRLARAQAEIVSLLERMQGDRVGLVMFAGSPFIRSPLTSDLPALARLLEGVHEERGLVAAGSDLGAAIRTAQELGAGGTADTRVLLIVSDGEDHGRGIAPALDDARRAGFRVYTGGAGTAAGGPVLDIDPFTGQLRPRTDAAGAPVVTRLDAAALTQMADESGGRYVELSGDGRPLTSLAPEFDDLARTLFETREEPGRVERFQIFAAGSLALAGLAAAIAGTPRLTAARRLIRLWPLGAAGLFVAAFCADDVAEMNRRGNRQYARSDYSRAVDTYRTAQARDASQAELYYNAGNALHQQGEYDAAIDETKRVLASEDSSLESAAEYALGNHQVQAGRLAEAVEAYKRALFADPADRDAKHNLEVITQRLRPTATPTPAPPEITGTPAPGGNGEPSGGANSTPQPGEGDATPAGTPSEGDPQDASRRSPEELARLLEEALRGIDEEFTVEEALRVLELLEQRNRSQLSEPQGGDGALPDY